MTMSGGFRAFPGGFVWEESAKPGGSFVDVLLERRQEFEPGKIFLEFGCKVTAVDVRAATLAYTPPGGEAALARSTSSWAPTGPDQSSVGP